MRNLTRKYELAISTGLILGMAELAILWWFIVCEPCLRYAWYRLAPIQ